MPRISVELAAQLTSLWCVPARTFFDNILRFVAQGPEASPSAGGVSEVASQLASHGTAAAAVAAASVVRATRSMSRRLSQAVSGAHRLICHTGLWRQPAHASNVPFRAHYLLHNVHLPAKLHNVRHQREYECRLPTVTPAGAVAASEQHEEPDVQSLEVGRRGAAGRRATRSRRAA